MVEILLIALGLSVAASVLVIVGYGFTFVTVAIWELLSVYRRSPSGADLDRELAEIIADEALVHRP